MAERSQRAGTLTIVELVIFSACLASFSFALSEVGWPISFFLNPFTWAPAFFLAMYSLFLLVPLADSLVTRDGYLRRFAVVRLIAIAVVVALTAMLAVTRLPLRVRFAMSQAAFESAISDAKAGRPRQFPSWLGAYYVQGIHTYNDVHWCVRIVGPPGFVGFVWCDGVKSRAGWFRLTEMWEEDVDW